MGLNLIFCFSYFTKGEHVLPTTDPTLSYAILIVENRLKGLNRETWRRYSSRRNEKGPKEKIQHKKKYVTNIDGIVRSIMQGTKSF